MAACNWHKLLPGAVPCTACHSSTSVRLQILDLFMWWVRHDPVERCTFFTSVYNKKYAQRSLKMTW